MTRALWLLWLLLFSLPAVAAPVILCDRDNSSNCANVNGAGQMAITGTISTSGTGDVVSATATFNANSICTPTLLTAGEQSAGFELQAGTLAATLTPQYSCEASGTGNFVNTQFVDQNGTKTATLVVTNPNALSKQGIVLIGCARRAQVCTTSFTSGSAAGFTVATFLSLASSGGGGGGGSVTQGTTPWVDNITQFGGTNVSTGTGASG